MAQKELHREMVPKGQYAQWPLQSDYNIPTKDGYDFDYWEFDGQAVRPPYTATTFGPINRPTTIKAKWTSYTPKADSNRRTVPVKGSGDTDTDITNFSYWAQKSNGDKIHDNVTLESMSLSSGKDPIVFVNDGTTSVDNGMNVLTRKVAPNDGNNMRYYKFRSKYTNPSGNVTYSAPIEIYQSTRNSIDLPPFDYMTFTYTWTAEDGKDLDIATILNAVVYDNGSEVDLSTHYVGFNGTSNDSVINKYLEWAGDNLQSGDEGTFIDWKKTCSSIYEDPDITTLSIDVYANWYNTKLRGNMTSITFKTYNDVIMAYVSKSNSHSRITVEAYNRLSESQKANYEAEWVGPLKKNNNDKIYEKVTKNIYVKKTDSSYTISQLEYNLLPSADQSNYEVWITKTQSDSSVVSIPTASQQSLYVNAESHCNVSPISFPRTIKIKNCYTHIAKCIYSISGKTASLSPIYNEPGRDISASATVTLGSETHTFEGLQGTEGITRTITNDVHIAYNGTSENPITGTIIFSRIKEDINGTISYFNLNSENTNIRTKNIFSDSSTKVYDGEFVNGNLQFRFECKKTNTETSEELLGYIEIVVTHTHNISSTESYRDEYMVCKIQLKQNPAPTS